MKTMLFKTSSVLLLVLVYCAAALAQQGTPAKSSEVSEMQKPKYAVGFQGSFPAYGLSGKMDITDTFTGQAIIGIVGNLQTFAGRGIYNFKREPFWDAYGYGMIGAWRYSAWSNYSETVLGFGAGAGIEYDWRKFDDELPPIYWNMELGLGFANFNKVNYNFSTIMFGVGVHYRF